MFAGFIWKRKEQPELDINNLPPAIYVRVNVVMFAGFIWKRKEQPELDIKNLPLAIYAARKYHILHSKPMSLALKIQISVILSCHCH
jgi:hypothetical protein